MSNPTVGIIGAGMAGLTCATELAKHGIAAVAFDKGRGAGGRMATRRVEVDGRTTSFDHGAQYFTARDPALCNVVDRWNEAGIVAPWLAAGADAWVGMPGMNAPLKRMAAELDIHWSTRIMQVQRRSTGWTIIADGETYEFDMILCAIPAEQAAVLLTGADHKFAEMARKSQSSPCWAAMAFFDARLAIEADITRSKIDRISWAARNSAKPGREGGESWVIHASPDYSTELLELSKEDAAAALLAAFFAQNDIPATPPTYLTAHRWLYAMAEPVDGPKYLWDADTQLGVCGDWLVQPRVEGAWQSGHALAHAVIASSHV